MHPNHAAVLYLKELGYPISNIRQALFQLTGFKIVAVAKQIGRSRQVVSMHMRGVRHNKRVKNRLAEVFEVPKEDLFPESPTRR